MQDKLLTVGVLVVGLFLGAVGYNYLSDVGPARHSHEREKCSCSDEGKCKCKSEGCGCPKGRRLGDLPSGDLPKGK